MSGFDLTPLLADPPHPYFTGVIAGGRGVGGAVAQLGDRWYMLDLTSDRYRIASVQAFRAQTDITERPGEQTLSTEGLWRRIPSTWHAGAGQTWFDRDDADPRRFNASRGINPWEEWELSLLNDVEEVVTEGAGWTSMAVGEFTGGQRLVVGGNSGRCVTIATDGTVTEVSGLTSQTWVTSNGSEVWVSDTTGIYTIDDGGTSVTIFNGNVTGAKIWFAKDRLFAADGQDLYDIVDDTTTTPFFTHTWANWEWTAIAEGLEYIYAAGRTGQRGQVYAIGIQEDATALQEPVVALPLPVGETPLSLYSYVGLVAVGTTEGLRLTQPEATTLTMGPIVGGGPTRCITGFGSFLWFGWDNTFSDGTGLGRAALETFTETLAPAYATDLMAPTSGAVRAAAHFNGELYFTAGGTVYTETDTPVQTGYLDTGRITFNVTDHKTAVFADLRHHPLGDGESIVLYSQTPHQGFALVGTSDRVDTDEPDSVLSMNHNRSVWHELRVELHSGTDSPILTGVSLSAQVIPDRSINIFLPIVLHQTVTYPDAEHGMDIHDEIQFLTGLARSQRLVRFRQGRLEYLVFVEDFEFVPHHVTPNEMDMQGTMVLKLKTAEVDR